MWPFTRKPKSGEETLAAARKASERGGYAEAEMFARQAMVLGDPTGEAAAIAGGAIIDLGDSARLPEALALLKEAAGRGNGFAMFNLHVMYAQGLGCEKDLEESRRWCLRSAESGYLRACYNAGTGFATGNLGFPKDPAQARVWYRQAADQGHAGAAFNVAMMVALGEGAAPDQDRATPLLLRAAQLGYPVGDTLVRMAQSILEETDDPKSAKAQNAVWMLAAAGALGHPIKDFIKKPE